MMCFMCKKLTVNRIFCSKKCKDVFHHKDKETL